MKASHKYVIPVARVCSVAALVAMLCQAPDAMAVANNSRTLDALMGASSQNTRERISPVRRAILDGAAMTLGTQTGLIERTREIMHEIELREHELAHTFRFGDLVIGAGVLPPVIVQSHNAQAVTGQTMRVAASVYKIMEPARFFSGAPNWRDWLMIGLPDDDREMPAVPDDEQLLPRDEIERAFWKKTVREAYESGRRQAQEIFDDNLATLEQTYLGMRTFYDLYQRKMVSAPIIAKSQELLTKVDQNTIVVGDTLFRITLPAQFNEQDRDWVALAATPDTQTPLPVVAGFDPDQVAHAYKAYRETQDTRYAHTLRAAGASDSQVSKRVGAVAAANTAKPKAGAALAPTKPAAAQPAAAQLFAVPEIQAPAQMPQSTKAKPLFRVVK